jgi:hypothetical protein
MGNIITRTLSSGRVAHYAQYVELNGKRTTKAASARPGRARRRGVAEGGAQA